MRKHPTTLTTTIPSEEEAVMATLQDTVRLFACKRCGTTFGGRKRRFCSVRCRQQYRNQLVSPPDRQWKCQQCGCSWHGRKRRFCSAECCKRARSVRLRVVIPCVGCSKKIVRGPGAKGVCAKCHSGRALRRKVPVTVRCPTCGLPFTYTNAKPRVYCSEDCKLHRHGRSVLDRRRPGAKREYYNRVAVFNRDKWICKVCGLMIPKERKYPHPLSASIDHRVALANGGDDTIDNVQAVHLRCNSVKGIR